MTLFDPPDAAAPIGPSLSFPPCASGCWWPTTGPASGGSPCSRGSAPSAGRSPRPSRRCVQAPGGARPAPGGPTPASTRGARWSTSTCRDGTDLERLHRSLLKLLGPAIVVREVDRGGPGLRCPLLGPVPHLPVPRATPAPSRTRSPPTWPGTCPPSSTRALLDLACDPFLGEHDFSAFCRRPKAAPGEEPKSLVRRVLRAGWDDLGRPPPPLRDRGHRLLPPDGPLASSAPWWRPARARSVPATSPPSSRAGNRAKAAQIAPGHGLMLWKVGY